MEFDELTFREGIPSDLSFSDYLLQRAEKFGDRPAFIDDVSARYYSYSQMIRNVHNCSAGLGGLGLRSGDRLCLLLPNSIEFPVVLLATLRLSAIVVPVNHMSTKYELAYVLQDSSPRFIVTTKDKIDLVNLAMADLPHQSIKMIIVSGSTPVAGYTTYESLLLPLQQQSNRGTSAAVAYSNASSGLLTQQQQQQQLPPERSSSFDNRQVIATICYSSGTTGKPKGCMQPHYNYIADSRLFSKAFYRRKDGSALTSPDDVNSMPGDVTIASLPMFHAWGTLAYIAFGISVGDQCVILSKFDALEYLRLVLKYKVTLMHVVPPLLAKLVDTPDADRLRRSLSSVTRILSSAVGLDSSLVVRVQTIIPDVQVSQGFGMTELLLTTLATPGEWKPGSSGKLFEGVSAKIVDTASGRELSAMQNGELFIRSPMLFKSYWNNEEATRRSFDADGWFKTGDFGHFDAEGNLYIVDRVKDLLKYNGFQVAPAELEAVLLLHPDIADAGVYGVKDQVSGDLPRAVIVTRRPGVRIDDIAAFVNERVSAYKRLRGGIQIVDEIPRNSSGKILRRLLTENDGYKLPAARL